MLRRYTALYIKFIKLYLQSLMEYRFNFFLDMFMQIFTYSITYISIWIIFQKFQNIKGWGMYEVMFLYSINLLTYALSGMFFKHPMLDMEDMVRSGSFDGILTKPANTLFQVVARQFQHGFIGHTVLCCIVFPLTFSHLGIIWTPLNVLWFIFMILGGSLIQASFMVLAGSTSFVILSSTALVESGIYGMRGFLDYPVSIYPKALQLLLTFVLPYAFINFYPAQHFLQVSESTLFHPILQYMTPLVGLVLFALSILVWNMCQKKYQSAGS